VSTEHKIEIRRLTLENLNAINAVEPLLDQTVQPRAAEEFLRQEGHHLLVAYDQAQPVGFVSGVEMTHPDKGTEMFLYELAVDDGFRRRGIGRQLVEALMALAQRRGCYGMWVLADTDNVAAIRTYQSAGGGAGTPCLLFDWSFAASSDARSNSPGSESS
jgi:ribosomal protein S18 acetylase RimI-like enzyme